MIAKSFAILEAPSVLGLFPKGVETLPDALLAAGLAERLGARRAGRVEPPAYDRERDPETLLLNPRGIADYAVALADAVGAVIDRGEFPVVLGGDCSILLGNLLALRRRGRYGLLFLDGHADFYQPEAEPNGEAASMDLALATGRGPAVVTDIEGRRPLVRDEDVVVLGRRDAADAEAHGSQRIEDTAIAMTDLAAVRAAGVEAAAARAVAAPVERRARRHLDPSRRRRPRRRGHAGGRLPHAGRAVVGRARGGPLRGGQRRRGRHRRHDLQSQAGSRRLDRARVRRRARPGPAAVTPAPLARGRCVRQRSAKARRTPSAANRPANERRSHRITLGDDMRSRASAANMP